MSRRKKTDTTKHYYRAICSACRHEFLLDWDEFHEYWLVGHCACPNCGKNVSTDYMSHMIEVDIPILKM